jgi:hypothetical protein
MGEGKRDSILNVGSDGEDRSVCLSQGKSDDFKSEYEGKKL